MSACARCGVATRPGARFCGACGARLGAEPVGEGGGDGNEVATLVDRARRAGLDGALAEALRELARGTGPRVVVAGLPGRGRRALAAAVGGSVAPDWGEAVDDAALAPLVGADVLLVALSAGQLLTAGERRALLDRVGPAVPGWVALAVGGADRLDDPEDLADLRRRLDRLFAQLGRTVPVFLLPGEAEALAAWVRAAVPDPEWGRARLRWALRALRARVADAPPAEPLRERALAEVAREEALARDEARSVIVAGLARLRAGLPDRSGERLGLTLGPAVEAEVGRLADDAVRVYLGAVERGLTGRGDRVVDAAAAGLGAARVGTGEVAPGAPAPRLGATRPRDPVSAVLAVAGAGAMALGGGPAGVIGGAGLLLGAWATRRGADARFAAAHGAAARELVEGWLRAVEPELLAGLDRLGEATRAAVEERVRALTPADDARDDDLAGAIDAALGRLG